MKKILLCILASILLVSCEQSVVSPSNDTANSGDQTSTVQTEKILVSSSIIPFSSLISTIGGEYVEVNNIVPAGVSPHGFDLSARQMGGIANSDIVFLSGLEHIDGFLEKAVKKDKKIHLADGIDLIETEGHDHHDEDEHDEEEHTDEGHEDEHEGHDHDEHEDGEHDEEEHEDEGHDEDAHSADPHVWLGKENITVIATKIKDELSTLLPQHAEYFSENTDIFVSDLEQIYADFMTETAGKSPREFIVFHDAYNYLMQSVGMDLDLKVPFSENVLHESGTAHMAELIEEIELHGIKDMFREPQFKSGNIEQFADKYNLNLGTLDPLGTDPSTAGYLSNIKANLTALSKIYE